MPEVNLRFSHCFLLSFNKNPLWKPQHMSLAASTTLKNFPHLATKLADHGSPNEEISRSANASCTIRTAISHCSISSIRYYLQRSSIHCAALAFIAVCLHRQLVRPNPLKSGITPTCIPGCIVFTVLCRGLCVWLPKKCEKLVSYTFLYVRYRLEMLRKR